MTKIGLEFGISVIVIYLIFGIWDLEFGISLPPVLKNISQSLILHVPAPSRPEWQIILEPL
jgi:hypothetical protein